MRSMFSLIGLLIVAVVVLLLAARSTRRTFRTASAPIPSLREDIAPQRFDRNAAQAMIERLGTLAEQSTLPEDELLASRETAAAWAAGSPPGSGEYRCAVKLRGAAAALLGAARGQEPRRAEARRLLREAGDALSGHAVQPGNPVGAIRDQIENLQQSQREKIEDVERGIDE